MPTIPYSKIVISALFFLTALIFYLFPQIDLFITGLFYEEGVFYLAKSPIILFIYDVTHPVLVIFFLASLLLWILSRFNYTPLFKRGIVYLYLISAILVGPGLVVNAILKDHVDRARPHQVTQFGGTKEFTPAFVISDQCEKNCSFVCGHASAGFIFIALAFLFQGRRRLVIFWSAVALGSVIGFVRIVQGGHFFSDVIFSFVFTYLSVRLVYYLFFEHKWKKTEELSQ